MSRLTVYCDEAGTMPLEDTDGPFVCAALGVTGQIPRPDEVVGRPEWILNQIERFSGFPHVSYVEPAKGYAVALKTAHGQLQRMAMITREQSGSNKAYVGPDGIPLRNSIWTKAMLVAIGQMLIGPLARAPVESIRIILDQKTMTSELRALFRRNTSTMGEILRANIRVTAAPDPAVAQYFLNNMRFEQQDISLAWSDELDKEPIGLKFAHYLASLSWKQLKSQRPGILDPLRATSYGECVADITDIITAPPSEKNVDQWRKNTGEDL